MVVFNRFRSNITDVTVMRSVSDAVKPSYKYASMRRRNGFSQILETVYSVEEDEDNQDQPKSTEKSRYVDRRVENLGNGKGRLQDVYGSFERLAQETDSPSQRPKDESQQAQVNKTTLHINK